jgi:hypothetical protein|tara:strand:+ start:131 stop:412 length:282 start_codon:yes stop_codon:yes gene_type:complete
MSDLISSGDTATEAKEAPADVTGGLKFAAYLVGGLLALVGISYFDLFGLTKKAKSTESEHKKDEETQADYEKEYLDEDISEDALDEHTVGLTA